MRWRVCPRFPNYEISDSGDLRRRSDIAQNQPGRRLRGYIDSDGYIRYPIRDKDGNKVAGVQAHVLVAEAFVGPKPSPKHGVAHGNGSRLLNIPNNLRWALSKDNHADRFDHGTAAQGKNNGRATINDADVRYIRGRYLEIKAARGDVGELDRKFGLHRSQIIRIAKRKAWSHVK